MYGWHFSKRMCEHAVSEMKKRNRETGQEEYLEIWDKQKLESVMSKYGMKMEDGIGYDAVYVLNMARADYYGSSVSDEQHLVMFVTDYLSDVDGYDEAAFTRYYADCIGRGRPIPWEDVI